MKKTLLLIAMMLCCATAILAQNNKISYQAVVRDTANRLVANKTVEVTVNIYNSTATTAAYTETQTVTTNYNGLISLLIGPDGNNAGWNSIQWNKARIETTVKLDGTELGTLAMPLTAVPYALYAEYADELDPGATVVTNIYNKMRSDSLALGTLIDANAAEIGNLKIADANLSQRIVADSNNLVNFKAKMKTDSTTLRNLIDANAAEIVNLKTADASLSQRIVADSNNLVNFKAKMKTDSTTLRNLINTNAENISELQETDEALSARITADSNNLVGFKAKMKTDSTTLRNLINTNAENISELQEMDEALSARITADSNNLVGFKAKMKTDSTTLRNLINTNAENIGELQEMDEALSARITADSNNLVGFKAKMKTDSTTLRNLINANTDNITITNNNLTALQNRVNTFNTNVCDSVDACVKGIVSDTASALRGLIKDTDDKFANYYTKTQTDNNIHDTANTVREEMSAQLATKADAANVYSKADMDQKLGAKADTAILAKVAKTGSYNDLSDKPTLADVTANGNSAGNRQLKDVSDPTDAQDAVTKSYLAAQLGALASWFQHQLDSLWGVIEAQQRLLDSLINGDTTFTCGTSTVTDYDNNTYNTVQIGNQCWMKENMRATHYANGDPVPAGGSNTSYYEPYYYDYSSSGIPLEQRGYLYNWGAAMHGAASSAASPSGVQGICPDGWHVPSHAEWTEMTDYVSSQSEYTCGGNSSNNAKVLASKEWWNTSTKSCAVGNGLTANNATGFSAVPAGGCEGSSFDGAGNSTAFWSSRANEGSIYYIFGRDLVYSETSMRVRTDLLTRLGLSVRCLRD